MCTNLLDVTFDLPSLLLLICLYLTPVWPSTPEIVPFHSSFLIKPFLVSTFLPVFAANVAFLLKANGAFVRQLGILISMSWKVSGSKIICSPQDLASDFYFMRRVQHLSQNVSSLKLLQVMEGGDHSLFWRKVVSSYHPWKKSVHVCSSDDVNDVILAPMIGPCLPSCYKSNRAPYYWKWSKLPWQLLPPLCWQTLENRFILSSAKMIIGLQQKSHVSRIFWCGRGVARRFPRPQLWK